MMQLQQRLLYTNSKIIDYNSNLKKKVYILCCKCFRLLNAFAEEAALEDAIYYMGDALRRGVIDLDVFLRQVRTLSRKQFMLRAIMQKCRQKAGLAY